MAALSLQTRYDGLVEQANALQVKINQTSIHQRASFQSELSAIDLEVLKLSTSIRKSASTEVNLVGLRSKIVEIKKLMYRKAPEESLNRVALCAFSVGVLGGAITGAIREAFNTSTPIDDANDASVEEFCSQGLFAVNEPSSSEIAPQSLVSNFLKKLVHHREISVSSLGSY